MSHWGLASGTEKTCFSPLMTSSLISPSQGITQSHSIQAPEGGRKASSLLPNGNSSLLFQRSAGPLLDWFLFANRMGCSWCISSYLQSSAPFGRSLGHKGGILINGISAYKEIPGRSQPLTSCEDPARRCWLTTRKGVRSQSCPEVNHAGTLNLDFPTSTTVTSKIL